LPSVGDWVAVRPGEQHGRALIRGVLPRRSWFSRKVAGREAREQVLAANVDVVFLVAALDAPPKPRSLERYLLLARQSGATPVVVLNKADVLAADDRDAAVTVLRAVAGDAPVEAMSARTGEGVERLRGWLTAGRTVALLGPSGAGKSTIINALVGESRLPTGEVRDIDNRGRHTSVHRQLLVVPSGGLIIDTPGLRELQLWDASAAVPDVFADIAALSERCRFRDCRHDREPGCEVRRAVEAGELPAARLENFLKLAREREALEKRRDERGRRPV
jgi:ribosome biogenesis GTPase